VKALDYPTKKNGYTALLAACAIGNLKIVQIILKTIKRREVLQSKLTFSSIEYFQSYDESLELWCKYGFTPFLLAAKYGHVNICRHLNEIGWNSLALCDIGQNALHYAIIGNQNISFYRHGYRNDRLLGVPRFRSPWA
jgi:ankyrin repeat protein